MRFSKGCPVALRRDLKLEEPPNRWQLFITWLLDSLTKGVPVVSTVGASSQKSPVSIWRGVVFVAFVVGMMAMGRGAWAFSCSDVTEIPNTECEALVDFYNSTNGANWENNTGWNVTNTPCNWHSISCSDGHVNRLELNDKQLSGSIPDSLGNLSNLQTLWLTGSQLSGSIPESFGNLINLQILNMGGNQLSGPIPESLGNLNNLTLLWLSGNPLGGSIPKSFGNLSSLQNLQLRANKLSGPIPESLGNLSNLQSIELNSNQLSGSLPESLGNLSNLRNLYMVKNQLSGSIPKSLGNLSNLQDITLWGNQLSGSIPDSFGNLSNLQNLGLNNNQLSGSIPDSLGNLSNLQNLDLNNNQLSGSIPDSLGNLSNLQTLALNVNQLSGSIPDSLSNLSNLQNLVLNLNQLSGSIPDSLSNLSSLTRLRLFRNQLSGSIPDSLGNLSNLQGFTLNDNQLSGSIPDSLGGLKNLESLVLGNNQLSGSIPDSLGNLSSLTQLLLYGNQLSGSIPDSLGNLSNLQSIHLSHNQLSGSIPDSLGNLSNLQGINLSSNQLSGSIPDSLGNLSNLARLWLHYNELCGDIPLSLMNLSNLTELRLNNNHLTAYDPDLIAWLNNLEPNWRNQTPCPAPKLATTVPPSICNGDSFDVTFQTVMTESQSVDTVTINLGFDPAVLQINSLTNSGVLDFEMVNNHDNGSIDFTAGVWGNPIPTQTFDMFTINFTALQATETTLTYDTSKSSLISEGVNIPYVVEDGQLTISNCFGYQVDLQRKNPKPDSSWETALEISIGTQTSATQYTDTCDENGQGNIALEGTLGNEDYICVKNAHTLANKVEAPIDISNIVDFGLLLEGDTNGNNVLAGKDFSLVFASKDKCTNDTGYNANADFNVDGCVTRDDAKFLMSPPIGNMGKTSACTWDSSLSMHRRGRRDSTGTVTLGTTAIPTGLMVGETFDYTIKVNAGTQLVDTASAYLNFDSEQLKVNTMLPGKTFDFVLQSSFDNELGNIDFAAGVWDNEVPKDTFTLVTINFTVLKVGGKQTLSFNTTGNRATTTVSGGSSVLAVDESGGPVIEEIEEVTGIYGIYGTIIDDLKNPIIGITLKVGNITTITDDAGNWEIKGLQEGSNTITAEKDGYTFAPENFALGNNVLRTKIVIKPISDLKVKVTTNSRAVRQDDNVTYTITVVNGGAEPATGIVLTDELPEGTSFVSIKATDGGECNADTLTCNLPNLTTGNSAKVELVIHNSQANNLVNTATVTSNEYPTEVSKKWTRTIPHLSVSISDTPDPIGMVEVNGDRILHYTITAELSPKAPSAATGVELISTLPKGVEVHSINSDAAMCEINNPQTVTCQLKDLSVANPETFRTGLQTSSSTTNISSVNVALDVKLNDAGLLVLTNETKVSALEYPAHTYRERTQVFIPPEYKVKLAFVIDVTGSMEPEMNGIKGAILDVIKELQENLQESQSAFPLSALVVFRDDVSVKAVTSDGTILTNAVGKLKASQGGTCPEASVEALNKAIDHVEDFGTILFVTDASPYDDADIDALIERLLSHNIRVNVLMTGDCTNPDSWNKLPSAE